MARVKLISALSACVFLLWGSLAFPAEKASETTKKATETTVPGEIITKVTAELLSTVQKKKTLLEEKPDQYFGEVRGLLEPVIDFESIAKNVMGSKSWTSIEKKDQKRFVDVFTNSLVRTYGKAMASFADLDVKVVKTWPSDNPKKKNYYVQQDVELEGGLAHIVYNMYPVSEGWKVRNVIIRDSKGYKLNMGKTFYTQFKHALSENKGNVVATIDGWGKED